MAQQVSRKPVDWAAMEPLYKAGLRSLRSLGDEFGVTSAGIIKHMRKRGIARDLTNRIQARALEQVNATAAGLGQGAVSTEQERDIIEVNAAALAQVQIAHRKDIKLARTLATEMLGELESVTAAKGVLERIKEEMDDEGNEESSRAALRDLASLVSNLPGRTKTLKELAETLRLLIGLEREAFGLNTQLNDNSRPLVIIRDFTGRGDVDNRHSAPSVPYVDMVPT